mmetsp:Transcript_17616/g.22634  ORF Transcript_17616/g.22634 Transcript_17616/m.22634 type:complete len:280 (+) Transcript_17616:124-963(+)
MTFFIANFLQRIGLFLIFFKAVPNAQGFSSIFTPSKSDRKQMESPDQLALRWNVHSMDCTPLNYENMTISDDQLFPYHDDHIIIAAKPSGMLSVPGREIKDSVATRAAVKFGHDRIDKMVCHRLDMMTSGLLVLARSPIALHSLHDQFRKKSVRKRYQAVVHGIMPCSEGQVDLPIRLDVENRPRQMIDPFKGKPSLTEWAVIGREPDRTRIELEPVTGRSHQLRIHMESIGHPILGDNFYGTEESRSLADRLMLHAYSLAFEHPFSEKPVEFSLNCPF